MFRFYYKSIKKQTIYDTSEYKRIEGGHWFSESFKNISYVYKITNRCIHGDVTIELITPLDSGVMMTPCWQDVPHQNVCVVQSEEDWVLFELIQDSGRVQRVLSGPLGIPQPAWVKQELEQHNIPEELLMSAILSCAPPAFSDLIDHEPPELQHQELQEGYPLQKMLQIQSSHEKHHAGPLVKLTPSMIKPPSKQYLSLGLQAPVFAVPKSVQIGSLCPPMNLPVEQSPRKLHDHRKVYQTPHGQVRAKVDPQCLIDLSLS